MELVPAGGFPRTYALLIVVLGSCWLSQVGAQNCQVVADGGTAVKELRYSLCAFPFTYRGVTYTDCTTERHGDTAWCSLDAQYNGRWGNCYVLTDGGTVPEGTKCVFPFEYRGVTYTECTTTKNGGKGWCSTDAIYNGAAPKWGNCKNMCNQPDANSAAVSCLVYTSEGTAPADSLCTFPFLYQGFVYSSCTSDTHGQPWCALQYDYFADKLWGNCNARTTGGTAAEGTACQFTFEYRNVTYSSCTTTGNGGQAWCSVDDIYNLNWGNCADTCITTSTVATSSSVSSVSAITPTSAASTSTATLTANPNCIQTVGGTVPDGSQCFFPFEYRGVTYYDCTTERSSQPWCSTTAVYSQKYGNCDGPCTSTTTVTSTASTLSTVGYPITAAPGCFVLTEGGTAPDDSLCQFPFTYKGTTYDTCITRDYTQQWCYVLPTGSKKWGNCRNEFDCDVSSTTDSTVSGATPTTATTTQAGICVDSFTYHPNTLSFLGIFEEGIVTPESCKLKCLTYVDCMAIDFNTRHYTCFTHVVGYSLNVKYNVDNVDQYRRC